MEYIKIFESNLFKWCEFEGKNYTNVYLIDHKKYKSYFFNKNGKKKYKNRNEYINATKDKNLYLALNSNGFQMFVENIIYNIENNEYLHESITDSALTQCFKNAFDN